MQFGSRSLLIDEILPSSVVTGIDGSSNSGSTASVIMPGWVIGSSPCP